MKKYAFLLGLCACNPAQAGENYNAWYLNQNIVKIDIEQFAKIVLACDGIENVDLAVTYTRYFKPSASKVQVIGLGFSTSAHDPLADCYQEMILKMGGVPLP